MAQFKTQSFTFFAPRTVIFLEKQEQKYKRLLISETKFQENMYLLWNF